MSLADEKILGLTVRAPHAELIARGRKPIEGRGWPPYEWMLGRYIAVHASRAFDQEGADFIQRNHGRFAVDPPRWEECVFGIVAVARLVGWVQRTENGPPKTIAMLPGHAFGDNLDELGTSIDWRWFSGVYEYGWVLREVTRISPVACNGRQKLWKLPPLVYESVRNRWQVARATATPPTEPRIAGT